MDLLGVCNAIRAVLPLGVSAARSQSSTMLLSQLSAGSGMTSASTVMNVARNLVLMGDTSSVKVSPNERPKAASLAARSN